jgi:very-short-patch-repair endonuclease
MFECKICGHICNRGSGHIKPKHGISTMQYLQTYEDVDIVGLYQSGQSAQQISIIIKDKRLGLNPIKKDILSFLKESGIEIRSTSEATKAWSSLRGGPWNKGLNKRQHSSIDSYSNSRRGLDNPYYKSGDESRRRMKWWLCKEQEEVEAIRHKIAISLKERYKQGTIIPYSFRNPEWEQKRKANALLGYKRYLTSEKKHKFGNPSLAEKEIASLLEALNIRYVRQFSVSDRYCCDFYLPEHKLVIEYYGTYWHCDPRKYDKEYYNQKKGKTAQQIWNYDEQREKAILENGYRVVVVWELDYKLLNLQQKKDLFYEAITSKSRHESEN